MSVCRWLLLVYIGAVFLAPHVLPAEAVYGFDFLARFSGITQMLCALAWAALFVPRSNRAIRRVLGTCVARAEPWPRTTRDRTLLAGCLALFWGLRSRTLYGDGVATVYHLGQGEWFNWKEPLDRALTQLATQGGARAQLWGPAEAMAGVSVFAGGIWVLASLACARLLGRSASEKSIVLGLLLTPGILQLFFGNLENYSLLASGVLVFLTLGLRYLRGRGSFAWPCLALALTCVTHLSACWLLPTLAFLYGARWRRERFRLLSQGLWLGFAATALPFAVTLVAGYLCLGSVAGLSVQTFGGGDGRLWKPLWHATGMYEKFALLSWAHALALANHLLLIAAVAGGITMVGMARKLARSERVSAELAFILVNLGLAMAYIIFFNPDMATRGIGLLNEWDLFSLPAIPAVVAAGQLLVEDAGDPEHRNALALLAIGTSLLTTAAWVLTNARVAL